MKIMPLMTFKGAQYRHQKAQIASYPSSQLNQQDVFINYAQKNVAFGTFFGNKNKENGENRQIRKNENGQIETITYFNGNNIASIECFDPETKKITERTCFDKNGKIKFIVKFDKNTERRTEFNLFHKDSNTNKFNAKFNPENNSIIRTVSYTKDEKIICIKYYDPETGVKIREKNYNDGNLAEEIFYAPNQDEELPIEINQYHVGGKTKMILDAKSGNTTTSIEYDKDGQVKLINEYDPKSMSLLETTTFKENMKEVLSYNPKDGSLISATRSDGTTKAITFYKDGKPQKHMLCHMNGDIIYENNQ